MPVRLAGFAAALVSATAVAGWTMPAAMPSPVWITTYPTRDSIRFDFNSRNATALDLHAALLNAPSQQTETWLFRWTPE
jgi:hypothetical protein